MARNSSFDKSWERMGKSVDLAFDQSAKRYGLTTDPAVLQYSNLSQDDFDDLVKDFGETDVLQYIQELERKRLLGE